jgi:hypothetical protein
MAILKPPELSPLIAFEVCPRPMGTSADPRPFTRFHPPNEKTWNCTRVSLPSIYKFSDLYI